jgi:hypothetical protein
MRLALSVRQGRQRFVTSISRGGFRHFPGVFESGKFLWRYSVKGFKLFSCALAVLVSLSAFAAVTVPNCKDINGVEKSGHCFCGQKEIGVRYDTCEDNTPMPQLLTQVSEKPISGETSVSKNGYTYRAIKDYLIGSFPDFSICLVELGVKRESDVRAYPGGGGESGSRAGCFARDGECPSLSECLTEGESANTDFKYFFYQLVYAKDHYGLFTNRSELKSRLQKQ